MISVKSTDDNTTKKCQLEAIEVIVNAMKENIDNINICGKGCFILWNALYKKSFLQESVCEKGGLNVLLRILKEYSDNSELVEFCCGAIDAVLSSKETHSKYCIDEVLRIVMECSEKHKEDEKISQHLLSLTRKEDPRVTDAVSRGVCTKEAFPKCKDECRSDEGFYCPKCCVQQKVFRCLTCDKDEIKFYCETCWKNDHQGHECEEFFFPARCDAKTK